MEVSKPVAASRLEKAFSQGIRTDYNYKKNQNDSQKVHSLGTFSVISVKTADEIQGSSTSTLKFSQRKQLKYIKLKDGLEEIEDQDFYHGYMTRSETEKLLVRQGQFLVRRTEINGEQCYVLSVFDNDRVKHIKIRQTRHHSSYWLHEFCFDSIGLMISYHCQKHHPVHLSGLILSTHVKREQWELYHEQIDLSGDKLGSGEFGEVMAGFLSRGVFSSPIPVAVKTLREEKMSSDHRCFYCFSYKVKETFCHEIVDGMTYLEQQHVIHRDLAARNVLLSGNSCKISDFGLSLLGKLHRESKLSRVPVRWLAPETLAQGIYSSKTDVWSFGVVVFEIFSDGSTPYGDIKQLSVVASRVQQGMRLVLPEETPIMCKELMTACFEADPIKRASFVDLKKRAPVSVRLKVTTLFSKYIFK